MLKKKLNIRFSLFLIIMLICLSLTYSIDEVEPSIEGDSVLKGVEMAELPPSSIVEDTIIVKFRPTVGTFIRNKVDKKVHTGIPSLDQLCARFEVKRMRKQFRGSRPPEDPNQVDLSRIYKVKFPSRFNPYVVVEQFSRNPHVEYAQVIGIHPVYDTFPDDTFFSYQWALHNTGQVYLPAQGYSGTPDADVDAPEAWDLSKGDSSVTLAIVDTGVDWRHPDLGGSGPDYIDGNIWINLAEYDGTPGVDDDGNGYIDDIRGWDWVDGVSGWSGEDVTTEDNDPMDFNGHGTHCSGIASAITNNTKGVAGLAWGCKIMALRAGWSGKYRGQEVGYVGMDFCAEAIYYATDMGATAINCSWGSSNTGGLGAAVDYAIGEGVLVVVAAGNDDSTAQDYLATRGDCIDVAATDADDVKASFSNYGDWVDVSAPGVHIASTYYDHGASEPANHAYVYMSGTSMSSPHVVGLIGLLKAYQPALSADQIKAAIFNSADNIDAENPGYVGQLGAGRINAYETLSSIVAAPVVVYNSHTLDDTTGGDGDLRADPGETDIEMTVTLINNGSLNATGVSATLTTTDPYVTIFNDSSTYPDLLAGGSTGDSITPYTFDVSSACPQGHRIAFELNITANEGAYTNTSSFTVIVGVSILIWDHDDGDLPFNGDGDEFTTADGEEKPFQDALTNLGYEFETLTTLPTDLSSYDGIFVVLGIYGGTNTYMAANEMNRLTSFMDAGGDVYIEGVDFGFDYGGGGGYYGSTPTELYGYFKCTFVADGSSATIGNVSTLTGTTSAITADMSFAYDYKDSPDHYVDEISAQAGASLIWKDQKGIGRGVSYDTGGSSQRIHTTIMLGGMTDGTSPSTRDEYIANVLGFFGLLPELSVQVSPSSWDLNGVSENSVRTSWTTKTPAGGGYFLAYNDGDLTEDLTISVASSASWDPDSSPGIDTFAMGFGQTVTQYEEPPYTNITVGGVPLTSGLAPGGMYNFDLEFQAPTSTAHGGEEQLITVTVGAVEAP